MFLSITEARRRPFLYDQRVTACALKRASLVYYAKRSPLFLQSWEKFLSTQTWDVTCAIKRRGQGTAAFERGKRIYGIFFVVEKGFLFLALKQSIW